MKSTKLKTREPIQPENRSHLNQTPTTMNAGILGWPFKLAVLLTMALVSLAAVTANTQKREKTEAEIAYEKSMTELDGVLAKHTGIEESNKKLDKSDQAQIEGLKILTKKERKILDVARPELNMKISDFNKFRKGAIDSGCPEEPTMIETSEAARCNKLADEINAKHIALQKEKKDQAGELALIGDMRALSSTTTFENAQLRKKNIAEINDLQARKLVLFSDVIKLALSVVENQAAAHKACADPNLSPAAASCCLSVLNDGKNPKYCSIGVDALYQIFKTGGVFWGNK